MILLSGYFFSYFWVIAIFIVFYPSLLSSYGYSPFQLGLFFAIPALMKFASPFFFLSRFELHSRLFIMASWATVVLWGVQWGVLGHFIAHVSVMVILGFVWSLHLPYIDERALAIFGKTRYGKSRLFGSAGFLIATLVYGYMPLTLNESLGHAFVGLTLMALLAIGLVRYFSLYHARCPQVNTLPTFKKDWYFWSAIIVMQFSFGAYYTFFTLYETSHGLALSDISWLWSLGVIAEMVMLYRQAFLLKFSFLHLMLLSLLVTALRWGIISFFPENFWLLCSVQLLHAFSFALFHTASLAWLFERYGHNPLAGQFYYGLSYGLGGFLGSLFFGAIYGEFVFLVAGVITLVGAMALAGAIYSQKKK